MQNVEVKLTLFGTLPDALTYTKLTPKLTPFPVC